MSELPSNWKALSKRAFKTSEKHGFHQGKESDQHYICLVISELMEAVEADRKEIAADVLRFDKLMKIYKRSDFHIMFNRYIKDSFEDELADAAIRLYDMIGWKHLELGQNPQLVWMLRFSETYPLTDNIYAIVGALVHQDVELVDRVEVALKMIYELARWRNVDLDRHIHMKMDYNDTREMLHGKKY